MCLVMGEKQLIFMQIAKDKKNEKHLNLVLSI